MLTKMEHAKKKRAQNWTPEEKEILRLLIAEKAEIIENKCNKTASTVKKNQEWKNIAVRFNEMTSGSRSDGEIKLVWKRMKLAAKANLSAHRLEVLKTGGGQKPPSPSVEDQHIMAIAPHDFIIEVNDFDSDRLIDTIEPVPGPSQASSEPYMEIHVLQKEEDKQDKIEQDIPVMQVDKTDYDKDNTNKKGKGKKNRKRNCDDLKETIINGNIDFKKKYLEMLKEEHEYKIEAAKLKLEKLKLQVLLLKEEKNKITKE